MGLQEKVGEKIKYDLQEIEGISEVDQLAREVVGKGFPETIQIQLS